MKKPFKKKNKIQKAYHEGWFEGFGDGVGIGMIEAVWILEHQQAEFGDIASINDLIDLVNKEVQPKVAEYKEDM